MKDLYKRLSREWGSLSRKMEGRQRKQRLRRLDPEEQREVDLMEPPNACTDGSCEYCLSTSEAVEARAKLLTIHKREHPEPPNPALDLLTEEYLPPPQPRKKDTKRWCKGKVGREHQGVCKTRFEVEGRNDIRRPGEPGWLSNWRYLVCRKCNKTLAYWFGGKGKDRPAWVTK